MENRIGKSCLVSALCGCFIVLMLGVGVITEGRAAFYQPPNWPERVTSSYLLEPNFPTVSPLCVYGPPSSPLGLMATGELNRISLSWSPPTENGCFPIVNYIIYRAIVSSNESYYATIGNQTSYMDNNTTIGLRYYYQVQAKNGNSFSSLYSNEANAQPLTLPSAPRNLQVSALSGQIDLTWNPPLNNGGSAVTQYRIYRATVSGLENKSSPITVFGTQLYYPDFAVVGGTTYYYEIAALTSAGEGAFSNEAHTIVYSHTSPPVGFAAIVVNTQVALSWSAPTYDGGSPVTGYDIYRGTFPGGESFYEFTNQTTFTDSSITAGATYFYLVKAINSAGASDYSFEVSVTLPTPSIPWYLYMAASIVVVGVTGGVAIAIRPLPPPTSGEFTVGFTVEPGVQRIRTLSEYWDRDSIDSPKDP